MDVHKNDESFKYILPNLENSHYSFSNNNSQCSFVFSEPWKHQKGPQISLTEKHLSQRRIRLDKIFNGPFTQDIKYFYEAFKILVFRFIAYCLRLNY